MQKMSKEKVATELKKISNHYQKTEERSQRKRKRERRHRKKLAVSQLKKKVDVRETQLENVNLVTLRATAAPMPVVIEVVQETLSSGPLVEVMEGTMMEEVQMVKVDRAHLGIRLVVIVVAAAVVAATPDTIILRTAMLTTRIVAHHPKQLSVGLSRISSTVPRALKASCALLITVLGITGGVGQTNWPTFAGH